MATQATFNTAETLLPQKQRLESSGDYAETIRDAKRETFQRIQNLVDPTNQIGAKKIAAAIKSMGLEPEDIDGSRDQNIQVSNLIPNKERATHVKDQRVQVWQGLQQARIAELRNILEGLTPNQERRFLRVKVGDGVRMVKQEDLPPVESLAGMGDFEEMQAKAFAKIKAEQQRKANILVTGFLQEKKRLDEADAQIEALEKRLRDYKKAQEEALSNKRKEAEKAAQRRSENVAKAAKDRAHWEDAIEEKLNTRLTEARATRSKYFSKETMAAKSEESNEKRQRAFEQAVELEQHLLQEIETKRQNVEERLEARRQQVEADTQRRRDEGQAAFQERQVRIYAQTEDWVENKLQEHNKFKERFETCNQRGKDNYMERSKSMGSLTKKATDKWKANYDKIMQQNNQNNDDLVNKHQAAWERTQERMALKLKCDNDIHTFREVKLKTWGELQRRRITEHRNARAAQTQALVLKVAEDGAKAAAQSDGMTELRKKRQEIARQSLALNDRAQEGFLKIRAEPDEKKIMKVMSDLGFKMPKLPDEEKHDEE
jgi:hypothetical protein